MACYARSLSNLLARGGGEWNGGREDLRRNGIVRDAPAAYRVFAVIKLCGFAAIRKRVTYGTADTKLSHIGKTICAMLPGCSIARTGRISLEFAFSPSSEAGSRKFVVRPLRPAQ